MAGKTVRCLSSESAFQAFDRAVKDGTFPPGSQLFARGVGKPQPEAPAGYVTVGSVLVRVREAFAVGVLAGSQPAEPPAPAQISKPAAGVPAVFDVPVRDPEARAG